PSVEIGASGSDTPSLPGKTSFQYHGKEMVHLMPSYSDRHVPKVHAASIDDPKKMVRMSPSWVLSCCALFLALVCTGTLFGGPRTVGQGETNALLPDGSAFVSWERPLEFTRSYYVDNGNPRASDANPGTRQLPFLTISKAAHVLEPGERVVIMEGVYRERVAPARGGTGPDK